MSKLVALTRATTKKLKNTRRLIFWEVRYTTVLKKEPSYFLIACTTIAAVVRTESTE
jgi:hypothetical protein